MDYIGSTIFQIKNTKLLQFYWITTHWSESVSRAAALNASLWTTSYDVSFSGIKPTENEYSTIHDSADCSKPNKAVPQLYVVQYCSGKGGVSASVPEYILYRLGFCRNVPVDLSSHQIKPKLSVGNVRSALQSAKLFIDFFGATKIRSVDVLMDMSTHTSLPPLLSVLVQLRMFSFAQSAMENMIFLFVSCLKNGGDRACWRSVFIQGGVTLQNVFVVVDF